MNTSKGRAASNGAYLEQKNVNATEENQEAADSSSSQEQPQSEPTQAKAPEPPRQAPNPRAGQQASPTPPPVPQNRSKTRILPERMQAEPFITSTAPAAHTPEATEQPDPTAALANLGWMPPAEDQVARFLNDVADIAPPPVREREGNVPHFVPPAISPEEARRKKAKADPFWSQVVATPMEQPQPIAPARPRRATRRRSRRGGRARWFLVAGGILLLVVIGLGVVVYLHPGWLPFK